MQGVKTFPENSFREESKSGQEGRQDWGWEAELRNCWKMGQGPFMSGELSLAVFTRGLRRTWSASCLSFCCKRAVWTQTSQMSKQCSELARVDRMVG
jgi:hypothetical protein